MGVVVQSKILGKNFLQDHKAKDQNLKIMEYVDLLIQPNTEHIIFASKLKTKIKIEKN